MRQLSRGDGVDIGRPTRLYHPGKVPAKIREIASRFRKLNLSAKKLAQIAREELEYSRPISAKYASSILRQDGWDYRKPVTFRPKKKHRHSAEQISASGKKILQYLVGNGTTI